MTGNRELAAFVLEPKTQHENFGYNKLHLDVLKLDKLTEKYATISITKKGTQDNQVTPLHFACVNPNVEVLETLLKQTSEVNVMDTQLNKPIHFAACCESPGPLELLLTKGGNLFDINTHKRSALHFAAINGRAENIRVILAS